MPTPVILSFRRAPRRKGAGMSCVCDYDTPDVVSGPVTRTARKDHQCCECRRPISAGEPYQEITNLQDGEWRTYRTCRQCAAVRDALEERLPCYCVYLCGLYEDGFFDHLQDLRAAETGDYMAVMRLVVEARRARRHARNPNPREHDA